MKILENIRTQQKDFIAELENKTKSFIDSLDKSQIQTILLSGSVARKDYFPGDFGGMIDLTVIRKNDSIATAEDIFGLNEDPEIPYHCITKNDVGFQIKFMKSFTTDDFDNMYEAQKFALLESVILYDKDNKYKAELEIITKKATEEIKQKLDNDLGYIDYLISDYKTDRWLRREANIQLHENLNTAIRVAVRCLFYANNLYAPAEDRIIYYSHSLKKLPQNYASIISELYNQEVNSYENYKKREKLFKEVIEKFLHSL